MARINVDTFLRICSLIVWSVIKLVIRLIKRYTRRSINDSDEESKSVKVLHRSDNFLIVDKPYDMYINSDDPDRKVRTRDAMRAYSGYPNKLDIVLFLEHPSIGITKNVTGLG